MDSRFRTQSFSIQQRGLFQRLEAMSTSRAQHTATLLDDGTVLVAGGFSYFAPGTFSSAEIFDPATNEFTPTGPMGDRALPSHGLHD